MNRYPTTRYHSLYHQKERYICPLLLILLVTAGWTTAIVFMFLWETCHAEQLAPYVPQTNSWEARFQHAAAATDAGLCSEIGRDIMKMGGNAVDAAIAGLLCGTTQNPHSMGLGGGFFMVIYDRKSGTCTAVDAREMSPARLEITSPKDYSRGWKSILVPGEIMGYWEVHKMFSKLNWRTLFEPTLRSIRGGVRVSEHLARALRVCEKFGVFNNTTTLSNFVNPNTGRAFKEGDLITYSRYARTLGILATSPDPVRTFYKGMLSKEFLKEFQAQGALITQEDLSNYKVRIYPAHNITLKNGDLMCVPSSPSSGPLLGLFMQVIQNFATDMLKEESFKKEGHIYHYLAEVLKFVYAEAGQNADIGFGFNVTEWIEKLQSEHLVHSIAERVSSRGKSKSYYHSTSSTDQEHEPTSVPSETSHLSFVDPDGNAVSVTSSINYYFGAGVRSEKTGIIWNNHLADFDRNKGGPNGWEPNKRPRSFMSPAVLINGKTGDPELVTGAAGGSKILAALAQVMTRVLFLNESLKEATDKSRLYIERDTLSLTIEESFSKHLKEFLKSHHHEITKSRFKFTSTNVQSIYRVKTNETKRFVAYCDSRKESYPAGF